jgi:SNF2 family DNA or RNA helicase
MIKKLVAKNRINLTGTPVENRLSDLWSLFDFLNPGLLGNAKEFQSFCKKLKKDHSAYGQLREVISPYVLRRLKTDKSKTLMKKLKIGWNAAMGFRGVALFFLRL